MITVEIDPHSGFCGGVIRAIGKAESFLDAHPGSSLYSLGDIVHNEAELSRLGRRGLVTLSSDDLEQMASAEGETLLVRAHGEPPQTYRTAAMLGFSLIDCTCPVVLRLQRSIREAYARLHEGPAPAGQVLIFGKIGHAEVLGLVGQVDGDALVVEHAGQLEALLDSGRLDPARRIELFSQTTMSPDAYEELITLLSGRMAGGDLLRVHRTVCSQVASRHRELLDFARSHDVIVFVAGRSSSNGKVLCALCRSVNIRTYQIGIPGEVQREWFRPEDRVGVCGATSTPKWLLEEVAGYIKNLQ